MTSDVLADEVKREVLAILARDGIDLSDKDAIREAQRPLWDDMRSKESSFIVSEGPRLINYFADGHEVIPERITPRIYPAYSGELASLFRFAIMCWGVPATPGMGRRLPMVIMDDSNSKIIGILNLCDGPYTLSARDEWIEWDKQTKSKNIHLISHSSIVGAVPPYNKIIGGKLVASLLASREVRNLYLAKHGVEIVLIGNTSALGRSSIYNRLKLFDRLLFIPVGYTKGYGRVMVSSELMHKMKILVGSTENMPHSHHIIQQACSILGIESIAKHGIARQVYVIPLASNARDVLAHDSKPDFFPDEDIARASLERWVIPRAIRDETYRHWRLENTWRLISSSGCERQLTLFSKKEASDAYD